VERHSYRYINLGKYEVAKLVRLLRG